MDRKKILIVDDERELVEFVKLRLEANNYQALLAYDGEEVLNMVSKDIPDLIILDILLPKMDGHKVCETLKKDPKYYKIPIIMLTAKDREEDIILAKNIGADAYISKPFDAPLLLYHIKNLVK